MADPDAASPDDRVGVYPYYVVWVLFAVYVFNYVDRQLMAVLLEFIKADLEASDTQMGFLIGPIFAVFYTFAGIPVAMLADRWVRRSVVAISITIWSALTIATGFVNSYSQLAAVRIGLGIGEAGGTPPSHALISDYFPLRRRATALGIFALGTSVGGLIGNLGGGWLGDTFGWRIAFIALGIPGLLLGAIVRLTVREPPRGRYDPSATDAPAPGGLEVFRELWSQRTFRLLAPATGLAAFAGYGFGMWAVAFLMRVHGMTGTEAGFTLGVASTSGGVLGTFLGGKITDRLGRRDVRWYLWWAAAAQAVALPFQALQLLSDTYWIAIGSFFPAALFGAMWTAPSYAIAQSLATPRTRALASALLLFFLNIIGLGLGPQAVGILNDVLHPSVGDDAVRYSLLLIKLTTVASIVMYWKASTSLQDDLSRAR